MSVRTRIFIGLLACVVFGIAGYIGYFYETNNTLPRGIGIYFSTDATQTGNKKTGEMLPIEDLDLLSGATTDGSTNALEDLDAILNDQTGTILNSGEIIEIEKEVSIPTTGTTPLWMQTGTEKTGTDQTNLEVSGTIEMSGSQNFFSGDLPNGEMTGSGDSELERRLQIQQKLKIYNTTGQ